MKRLLLTLLLVLAPAAMGATQLEAMRANAQAARASVNGTRSSQLQAQGELNKLAARIEELKAKQKGKLLPGSELDEALKKSQELSASLTSTASSLQGLEAGLESANLALLSELSNELNRLRADFDRQTDRAARTALIGKMRKLRSERDQVRAMLPAAKLPALEVVKPSDDPEDLLEQADLLKDNEDKVRKQLQAVEQRIAEAKSERDLDSRVRQFLGDEAMFDESDRRLRVTRTTTEQPAAADPSRGPDTASPPPNTPRYSAGEAAGDSIFPAAGAFNDKTASVGGGPSAPNNTFESTGVQNTPPGSVGGAGGTRNPAPVPAAQVQRNVSGADVRPTLGGRIAGGGGDDDDDLEDLEIQRAKLKGLAEELKLRAKQLEKKAAQLK
ncbi:MAG: TetR family transcriptional regulator [Myxococcaceae bacterium]|nr:TetR family transcriptional regulator [Myxococcaceae bacterium]